MANYGSFVISIRLVVVADETNVFWGKKKKKKKLEACWFSAVLFRATYDISCKISDKPGKPSVEPYTVILFFYFSHDIYNIRGMSTRIYSYIIIFDLDHWVQSSVKYCISMDQSLFINGIWKCCLQDFRFVQVLLYQGEKSEGLSTYSELGPYHKRYPCFGFYIFY